MAIESEVAVIGGGLAGLTSALAARRQGADVRLVSYKQSTLRNASGLIDLLGYLPGGEGPISNPYDAIPRLPDAHPYRTVGVDGIRQGMALFDSVTPAYRGSHTEKNTLVPTHGGTIKPTARYPNGTREGLATDDRDVLLVGLDALTDFDAPHAAEHLEAAGVPFDVRGVSISFPGDLRADAKVTRYAKLLDTNAAVTVDGRSVPAREALAERVRPHLKDEERIGFPAVLGLEQPAAVRESLQSELDAAIFEVPMGPPSLPGIRLEEALVAALDEEGVSMETGNPVVAYDGEATIDRIYVEKNGAKIPNRADQYILATGGLVGKGVQSNRDGVFEPIFDCHVPHPNDRYAWFDSAVFGDHPFAGFGVPTDPELRPVGPDASPEFDNLRAAGAVLGGCDFAAEKSGSGVSIATGVTAGRAAAEAIQ